MQPTFPVSYSTLSQDALSSFISTNYNLEEVTCRLLSRGVGDTYLVLAARKKYVFRVYRIGLRTIPVIESEVKLLLRLKEADVSVSFPLPDKNGGHIQPFFMPEGVRYGVLFSFAEGRSHHSLNEAQLKSLGHEMAKFHLVSAKIHLPDVTRKLDLQTTLFDPLERTRDFFIHDREGYNWLCEAAGKIARAFAQMDTTSFSNGYCHFDFLPKNFHFDERDQVTFFDFDFLGYGWLINDIMVFWQHLCLDVQFKRLSKEAAEEAYQIFLKAYGEARPLTNAELTAIPYLALGFWLFYMEFHSTHDQFYQLIFEPATLKMRTAFIRQLMETNLPELFLSGAD